MFRQKEVFWGGWPDKTLEAMQKRRFEQSVKGMEPLAANRLAAMPQDKLQRRLEQSWQNVKRKPMYHQQLTQVWKCVLENIEAQADCLSNEEHDLVERAIILGGTARIEDAAELEAAHALALRLWANVGLISGQPCMELELAVRQPVARAFAREEHDRIRARLNGFHDYLTATLYRVGAMDDRQPQRMILREVLNGNEQDETLNQLARRYLWASYDCMDYSDGVMLIHPALADPQSVIHGKQRSGILMNPTGNVSYTDILPEEIPLQREVEQAIFGALRDGRRAEDVARSLRLLCKQGAPLAALEEVLQASLIVYLSEPMRAALSDMFIQMPKWIMPEQHSLLQ